MLTKTQLKEVFSRYGFRPLKRLGENYLIDGNIRDKIISEAGALSGDRVLEIGPGLGALTIDLARSGAAVTAVEKDKKAYGILEEIIGDDFPSLRIFNEDILKFDIKKASVAGKLKVVGCLPYYITTPIIECLIDNRLSIKYVVMVVQKEFADRILAEPGAKDYSSLSCFIQYYTRPKHIYKIKRTSFYPSPDIDSSLVRLDILDRPSVEAKDDGALFKVIRGSFNQRRKSIINSLSREEVLGIPKERLISILEKIAVDPASRPESLSLADFARIANSID